MHTRNQRIRLLAVVLGVLVVASVAAYYGTILVFARDHAFVPYKLVALLPDALYPAGLLFSVAFLVCLSTALATCLACVTALRISFRRAVVAALGVGIVYLAALLSIGYIPGALVDRIPGYAGRAGWCSAAQALLAAQRC